MSARVLVVDDIAANVRLLEAKLAAEYFEVMTASSGKEALTIIEKQTPDIVLAQLAPNLKKQGMLALTFADKNDYDKIREDDSIDINGLTNFTPGQPLELVLHHADGSSDTIVANHSYNEQQIEWFKAGAALNIIRQQFGG